MRLDRYSTILRGAYGIRDNLDLWIAIPGVHTAAEVEHRERRMSWWRNEGIPVHAAWQVDPHYPIRDDVRDLDYRAIAGVTYSA